MTNFDKSGKNESAPQPGDAHFFDPHDDIDVPVYRRDANSDDATRPVSAKDQGTPADKDKTQTFKAVSSNKEKAADPESPVVDEGPIPAPAKGEKAEPKAATKTSTNKPQPQAEKKAESEPEKKAEQKPSSSAAKSDADKTEVLRPKRDVYAMLGRARPQRIEAKPKNDKKSKVVADEPRTNDAVTDGADHDVKDKSDAQATPAQPAVEKKQSKRPFKRSRFVEEDKTEIIRPAAAATGGAVVGGGAAAAKAGSSSEPAPTDATNTTKGATATPKDATKQPEQPCQPQADENKTQQFSAQQAARTNASADDQDASVKESQIPAIGGAGAPGAAAGAGAGAASGTGAAAAYAKKGGHAQAQPASQQSRPTQPEKIKRNPEPVKDAPVSEEHQTSAFSSPAAVAAGGAAGAGSAGAVVASNRKNSNQGGAYPQTTQQPAVHNSAGAQGAKQDPYSAPYGDPQADPQAEGAVVMDEDKAATSEKPVREKRGTLGLGILILRLVAGGWLLVMGLQNLFGLGGASLTNFEAMMFNYNYADMLALGLSVGAVVGGASMIIGLLTPLGAAIGAVVAGFMGLHALSESTTGLWPSELDPTFTTWALIAVMSLAIVFTGPARASFDRSRGWATRPLISAWLFALIAVAGLIGLWFFVGGGNPLA